jgi:hypothetical protein
LKLTKTLASLPSIGAPALAQCAHHSSASACEAIQSAISFGKRSGTSLRLITLILQDGALPCIGLWRFATIASTENLWHFATMKTAPSDNQDKFIIRMPNGLRDRIKKRADANNRSMNAEIVQVLEKQYPEPTDVMYVHAENIRIALDLYEAETDPDARMRLQIMVEGMATMGHSLEIDWNEEEWSE